MDSVLDSEEDLVDDSEEETPCEEVLDLVVDSEEAEVSTEDSLFVEELDLVSVSDEVEETVEDSLLDEVVGALESSSEEPVSSAPALILEPLLEIGAVSFPLA